MRSRYGRFLAGVHISCRRSKEQTFVFLRRGHFIPAVQMCDKISLAKYLTISTPGWCINIKSGNQGEFEYGWTQCTNVL